MTLGWFVFGVTGVLMALVAYMVYELVAINRRLTDQVLEQAVRFEKFGAAELARAGRFSPAHAQPEQPSEVIHPEGFIERSDGTFIDAQTGKMIDPEKFVKEHLKL